MRKFPRRTHPEPLYRKPFFLKSLLFLTLLAVTGLRASAWAKCDVDPMPPIKVEAWLSKEYEKHFSAIREDFAAMGDTRVALFAYPAKNPSRTVAIGRCVPAYIARHALRKAHQYLGQVDTLVHQGFISDHWVAVGTSLFNDLQQSRKLNETQIARLMDESLETPEFQALYREYTRQEEIVPAFGLKVPNPKLLNDSEQE